MTIFLLIVIAVILYLILVRVASPNQPKKPKLTPKKVGDRDLLKRLFLILGIPFIIIVFTVDLDFETIFYIGLVFAFAVYTLFFFLRSH